MESRKEANPEPPDAVSEPDREALLATCLGHAGAARAHYFGLGLARLDTPPAPENLSSGVLREHHWCSPARQSDDHPVGDEDRSRTKTRDAFARGCGLWA